MKKIEFLVDVPDKYTKEMYTKGQVREFEDKRAEEILSKKRNNGEAYAREIKEVETATTKVKAETAVKKTRKKKENDV